MNSLIFNFWIRFTTSNLIILTFSHCFKIRLINFIIQGNNGIICIAKIFLRFIISFHTASLFFFFSSFYYYFQCTLIKFKDWVLLNGSKEALLFNISILIYFQFLILFILKSVFLSSPLVSILLCMLCNYYLMNLLNNQFTLHVKDNNDEHSFSYLNQNGNL